MPRASDYLLPGYTYHLTQRCHNREFLLRFGRDRNAYRRWLHEGVKRHQVPVYGFCITHNHVHILAHVDNVEDVSRFMHLASGSTAKQYNIRKHRAGSMWQHPYHCTIVEDGQHLLNCLVYINLNMVRVGMVGHPREWKWCGHDELMGHRQRYRIVNMARLLESADVDNPKQFRTWYADALVRRIERGNLKRESVWTDSLAVGSKKFIERTTREYTSRWTFDLSSFRSEDGTGWAVRETSAPYSSV